MARSFVVFTVVAACCLQAGCFGSKGPKGPKREPVFPVSGSLKIDGEPAVLVRVNLFPADKTVDNPTLGSGHSAVTDKDGNFKITTYESGDGAPAGEYLVGFYWQKTGKTIPFDNPDEPRLDPTAVRFNRKYLAPGTNSPKVTVEAKTNTLEPFDLKSK